MRGMAQRRSFGRGLGEQARGTLSRGRLCWAGMGGGGQRRMPAWEAGSSASLGAGEVRRGVFHWGGMGSVCGSKTALPRPLPPRSSLSPSGPAFCS